MTSSDVQRNLVYYVSLAYFHHKVFKCAGRCPSSEHRAFYEKWFAENGDFGQDKSKGPFRVIVAPYQGDKIDLRKEGAIYEQE